MLCNIVSNERNIGLRNIRHNVYEHAKKIADVFNRVDPDHESDKLCPRCIREHKRILMGIKFNPKDKDAIKKVYVCGTCQLQISELLGQSPMTGALNPDDVVSLINNPEGKVTAKPDELGGYEKRHPEAPETDRADSRFLKDIVADLEKNYIANLHGNSRYMYKRKSTMSQDIHQSKN